MFLPQLNKPVMFCFLKKELSTPNIALHAADFQKRSNRLNFWRLERTLATILTCKKHAATYAIRTKDAVINLKR